MDIDYSQMDDEKLDKMTDTDINDTGDDYHDAMATFIFECSLNAMLDQIRNAYALGYADGYNKKTGGITDPSSDKKLSFN